jgi:hypothetical protein
VSPLDVAARASIGTGAAARRRSAAPACDAILFDAVEIPERYGGAWPAAAVRARAANVTPIS